MPRGLAHHRANRAFVRPIRRGAKDGFEALNEEIRLRAEELAPR